MTALTQTTLWTAIITPMQADGAIDFSSLTHLLNEQAAAGNGIVLLGSTGEGSNLSSAERRAVVEHACGLKLSVPLLVGVGGLELHSQLEWVRFCETQPLAGYLLVTPIYAKPGAEGQLRWFRALMDAVTKPCMLYNIPSRSGVLLSEGALEGLTDHPNWWAVKDSGGNAEQFARLQQRFSHIAWYSGDDVFFGDFAPLGAAGLVSVASNVWPVQVAEWVKQGLAGKAAEIGPLLKQVSEPLFCAANPIPAKALMKQHGRISDAEVRLPLCAADLASLEPLLKADQLMSH